MKELTDEFAVPEDLLQLYSVSDIDREYDFLNAITGTKREEKLVDIAGLEQDGQYELDAELLSADPGVPTKIKVLSGECSIIARKKLHKISKTGEKIVLDETGWVSTLVFNSRARRLEFF